MDVVRFGAPKAFIAPHGEGELIRYSVFVDLPDGNFELSPDLETPTDALQWALERADFVLARGSTGPYYWYGRGAAPPGIASPPT